MFMWNKQNLLNSYLQKPLMIKELLTLCINLIAVSARRNYYADDDYRLSGYEVIAHIVFLCFASFLILHPPEEFIGVGLSLTQILEWFIDRRNYDLVGYSYKLIIAHFMAVSFIPIGIFGYLSIQVTFYEPSRLPEALFYPHLYYSLLILSVIGSIFTYFLIYDLEKWKNSKIIFDEPDIRKELDIQLRRNSTHQIVISKTLNKSLIFMDDYFVFVSNWDLKICKSNEVRMTVLSVREILLLNVGENSRQLVRIKVEFDREGLDPLFIALTTTVFRDMRASVDVRVTIPNDVIFAPTLIDRFVEAFKNEISKNERYEYNDELEPCFSCATNLASVKIQKSCIDEERFIVNQDGQMVQGPNCQQCYCRPMWCTTCIARIFHSKQNENEQQRWLNGICTCPTCVSVFCVKDVHLLQE